MEAHIVIPGAIDDVDVLVWRLQKFAGILVRAEGKKIVLQGPENQLLLAQNYALRFLGPESIHCLHVSCGCLALLRVSGLIKNFEDTFDVIVCLKEGQVVILKGRKTDTDRFLVIFKTLDSQCSMHSGNVSLFQLSNLRFFCETFHVAFDEVPCDPVLQSALLTYFSSIPDRTGLETVTREPVAFLEIYRKHLAGPLASQNSDVVNSECSLRSLPMNARQVKRASKSADRENMRPAESLKTSSSNRLRAVVIDGSNVAYAHGKQREFSPWGIQLAVDFFLRRGHTEVVAVVPRHRHAIGGALFDNLERQGYLTYSSARFLDDLRQVSDDDKVILRLAVERDAVVVSNDQFRKYRDENEQFKDVIDNRLLQYTLALDTFLVADDPHGANRPSLSDLLRRS